jgi:hypothetical protein
MKQIWPNYSYSPTTNVLTLTGLNIDRDQLLLVTAADRGRIMYNFADSSVTASAFTSGANTALTLVATTAGLTTTAALVIYYDDQLQSTAVSISNLPSTQTIAGTVTANAGDLFYVAVQNGIQSHQETNGFIVDALLQPLPAGTNRIGVVTIGGGTVTIGAGTSQIGSVTASISGTIPISISSVTIGNSLTIGVIQSGYLNSVDIVSALRDGDGNVFGLDRDFPVTGSVAIQAGSQQIGSVTASLAVGTNRIGVVTIGGGTVTIGAGTAQIGSVTASISNSVTIASLPAISGTVTANTFALQGTAVTTSNFTSTTASTVLANFNATREVLTIFNEGAGNLHICAGATCTTIAYQVRLFSGDYYEVPNHQTSLTHSAVFATAGTARIVQIS